MKPGKKQEKARVFFSFLSLYFFNVYYRKKKKNGSRRLKEIK